jgi:SAM-dependent methyltransferase
MELSSLVRPRPRERASAPLHLDAATFRYLFEQLGPSLGLWRAAEIAVLRAGLKGNAARPVLDLGCGDGEVMSRVLPHIDIGLDPDAGYVGQAQARGVYGRFEVCPAEHSQLPAGSVATVISNSVLEHIADVDGVLASVARMLQPGGRFIFTSPTEAFSAWLAAPFKRYADWRNRRLIHINLWSLDCWRDHLGGVGLDIVEVRPYLSRQLVTAWDTVDMLESVWIGKRRVAGALWKSLPPATMERIAARASQLDLSAREPGGGRLVVAIKR